MDLNEEMNFKRTLILLFQYFLQASRFFTLFLSLKKPAGSCLHFHFFSSVNDDKCVIPAVVLCSLYQQSRVLGQACQKMSFPTNDVVLEGRKSAKFWKCRQSFLCRFWAFHVVFMSFYEILRQLCRFWGFVLENAKFCLKKLKNLKKFCLRQPFCFNSPLKVPKVALST